MLKICNAFAFFCFMYMSSILVYTPYAISKEHETKAITWEELVEGISYCYTDETIKKTITEHENANQQEAIANKSYIGNSEKINIIHNDQDEILNFKIHLVKIDPEKYIFDVYGNFIEKEKKVHTLPEWSTKYNLSLAINASMYLTDNSTSIGYMRSNLNVNNSRVTQKMHGFFIAQHKQDINPATFIEKSHENWEKTIEEYDVVIQNFRILGDYDTKKRQANILWNNNSEKNPIAAYGNDIEGNIYFIFSQNPSTIQELAKYLINFSKKGIYFKTILYAEGGKEAALYINTPKRTLYINGLGSTVFDFLVPVPNILGVTKR